MRKPDATWSGRPVYRCRSCGSKYERVDNLDAVLAHEIEAHGPTERVSSIVGPDSKPLIVPEGGAMGFSKGGVPVVLHGKEAVTTGAPAASKKPRRARK